MTREKKWRGTENPKILFLNAIFPLNKNVNSMETDEAKLQLTTFRKPIGRLFRILHIGSRPTALAAEMLWRHLTTLS